MKIEEILEFNKNFVATKEYEKYPSPKYPKKKIAILTCMDTRLTELLPAALNFKNGDVKLIKNAGALLTHPFGSIMRSILVAVYQLEVNQIFVINHYDCGMQSIDSSAMIDKMKSRGITDEEIDFLDYLGHNVKNWLHGFDDAKISVTESVKMIRTHPLIPKDISVSGYLMDPDTGRLDVVVSDTDEI